MEGAAGWSRLKLLLRFYLDDKVFEPTNTKCARPQHKLSPLAPRSAINTGNIIIRGQALSKLFSFIESNSLIEIAIGQHILLRFTQCNVFDTDVRFKRDIT